LVGRESVERRRRTEREEVGELLIVTFTDRKLLDEMNIQLVGEELFALAEEGRNMVLSFANVEYLSSALLGKLITLQRQMRPAGCRLGLCDVSPEIREVFGITKLDRLFSIYRTRAEAIAILDERVERPIEVSCPVSGCGGWTEPVRPTSLAAPAAPLTCRECGARFRLGGVSPAAVAPGARVPVAEFRLETYDGEAVRVEVGPPVVVQVLGSLDLFASEVLDRARLSLPEVCPTILDLRGASDITQAGFSAVLEWCTGGRTAVLVDPGKPEQAGAFSPGLPVYDSREAAVQALGCPAGAAEPALTASVRWAS
jgi:anti-sigma B factor antagonist